MCHVIMTSAMPRPGYLSEDFEEWYVCIFAVYDLIERALSSCAAWDSRISDKNHSAPGLWKTALKANSIN